MFFLFLSLSHFCLWALFIRLVSVVGVCSVLILCQIFLVSRLLHRNSTVKWAETRDNVQNLNTQWIEPQHIHKINLHRIATTLKWNVYTPTPLKNGYYYFQFNDVGFHCNSARLLFFFRPDHIEFFHLCVRFFSSPGESSKPKAENKTLGVRANKTNPHWMEWERENK